ncbi:MAG: hypothetical protein K0R38_7045 [Polyangiaceae bacterium]|jgi:hypothetical protein|nr:hypothetical protein [Polyangiaceae bacterium]
MASKLNQSSSAYLPLDHVPDFESSDATTAYWRKLLEIFIAPRCDSFSLSDVDTVERMAQVACFKDWQPSIKDRALVRFEWDIPAVGRKRYEEELTRFRLDGESLGRLMQPQFHYWFISSDIYPADKLYFFEGTDLLIEAEPHELALSFYNLTPAHRDALWSILPAAVRAFDESRNWVAATLRVSDPK